MNPQTVFATNPSYLIPAQAWLTLRRVVVGDKLALVRLLHHTHALCYCVVPVDVLHGTML